MNSLLLITPTPHILLITFLIDKTRKMEPITTSTMIGGIVAYLGGRLSKEKSITSFISEFTEATVNWIQPLFLKADNEPKEMIKNMIDEPKEPLYQDTVKNAMSIAVKKNPEAEKYIKEIFNKISKTEEGGKIVNNILGSTNVNTGNVNTGGGDFRIGNSLP